MKETRRVLVSVTSVLPLLVASVSCTGRVNFDDFPTDKRGGLVMQCLGVVDTAALGTYPPERCPIQSGPGAACRCFGAGIATPLDPQGNSTGFTFLAPLCATITSHACVPRYWPKGSGLTDIESNLRINDGRAFSTNATQSGKLRGDCKFSTYGAWAAQRFAPFSLQWAQEQRHLALIYTQTDHMLDGLGFRDAASGQNADKLNPFSSQALKPKITYCQDGERPDRLITFERAVSFQETDANQPDPCSSGTCVAGDRDAAYAGDVRLDPARSAGTLTLSGGGSTRTVAVALEGVVFARQENCVINDALKPVCDVAITYMNLSIPSFSVGGKTLTLTRVMNDGVIRGTLVGETFVIPSTTLVGEIRIGDDERARVAFGDEAVVLGVWDPQAGNFGAVIGFSTTIVDDAGHDIQVVLQASLGGDFRNISPVAEVAGAAELECAGPSGTVGLLDGRASTDLDGDVLTYEWFAGGDRPISTGATLETAPLGIGDRAFSLRVSDTSGWANRRDFSVSVVDTQPPELSVSASSACLWPPNHQLVRFDVGQEFVVEAVDQCAGDLSSSVRIVAVSSSEAADALGDGSALPDILFDQDTVCLRAERSGGGAGRTYTVTFESEDPGGNVAQRDITIAVPHDLSRQGRCFSALPSSGGDCSGLLEASASRPALVSREEPYDVLPSPSGLSQGDVGCSAGGAGAGAFIGFGFLLILLRRRASLLLVSLLVFVGCGSTQETLTEQSVLVVHIGEERYDVEGSLYLGLVEGAAVFRLEDAPVTLFMTIPRHLLEAGELPVGAEAETISLAVQLQSGQPVSAKQGTLVVDAPGLEDGVFRARLLGVLREETPLTPAIAVEGALLGSWQRD